MGRSHHITPSTHYLEEAVDGEDGGVRSFWAAAGSGTAADTALEELPRHTLANRI